MVIKSLTLVPINLRRLALAVLHCRKGSSSSLPRMIVMGIYDAKCYSGLDFNISIALFKCDDFCYILSNMK